MTNLLLLIEKVKFDAIPSLKDDNICEEISQLSQQAPQVLMA
jgi:hypothetical protein